MEIKIPIYKVNIIKRLFRKPIYVFEVPFVYPKKSIINDIIFNTYIIESDSDKLKYNQVSNVRMYVKQNDYKAFINGITNYYKSIRIYYPKYIPEILRKSAYVSNLANAEVFDEVII